MYKTGDLTVIRTEQELRDETYCDEDETPTLYDNRNRENITPEYPVVYLPHSCDRWVIGGREQILTLIHDLQMALFHG